MNIVVYMKQTFNTEAKIVLDSNGKIEAKGVNLIINPYDEYAIEEGIRLKEKFGGEVTVVSLGESNVQAAMRTAMAMGADKGILISDPALENTDEWARAEILAKALSTIPFDIILAGRIAIDDCAGQIAIRLAEVLNVPSVGSVVKLEVSGTQATVTREIDGGTALVEVSLPAVITTTKGLNDPRYPSVAGIMKSKKKKLDVVTLADLGFSAADIAPKMNVQKHSIPSARKAGQKITGEAAYVAQELGRLLREEAKIL